MGAARGRRHGRRRPGPTTRVEIRLSGDNAVLLNGIADELGLTLSAFMDEFVDTFINAQTLNERGLPTWYREDSVQEELPQSA